MQAKFLARNTLFTFVFLLSVTIEKIRLGQAKLLNLGESMGDY